MPNTTARGRLHGKTGSMTGVSAISGSIDSVNGERFILSMISNNFIASPHN